MASEVSKVAQILCFRPETREHSRAVGARGREGCHLLETRKQTVIGRDLRKCATRNSFSLGIPYLLHMLPDPTVVHKLRAKPQIHDEHIRDISY